MLTTTPHIYPLCENAITIELGSDISEATNRKVIAIRDSILTQRFNGLIEVVSAYTTVTVFYNPYVVIKSFEFPGATAFDKIKTYLENIVAHSSGELKFEDTSIFFIPVCYEKEYAPDLAWLAEFHKTTTEEIIRKHTNHDFTVFMIGFTPGFPYMGILPEDLQSPRKKTPRTEVPAGSVAIAGRQTGIYPFATPGGWQIIGRTPLKLFSAERKQPALLKAGDKVRFKAVSSAEFMSINNQ
jgi:inhibitor of KinA